MKKILLVSALVIVAIVALGVAGYAYAQSQTPASYPYGQEMMGGRGGMWGGRGGMMDKSDNEDGVLHDDMINAIAEAFDMTPADLQARLDAGDTCWTIAQEKGLSQDDFNTLMKDTRTKALQQAVADGVITQQQADWMLEHMNQMWNFGDDSGGCQGGGMGRGRGPGRWNSRSGQPQG
jgi:hypothetical protein